MPDRLADAKNGNFDREIILLSAVSPFVAIRTAAWGDEEASVALLRGEKSKIVPTGTSFRLSMRRPGASRLSE